MWSVVVVRGPFETRADACRYAAGYAQLDPRHIVSVEVVTAEMARHLLDADDDSADRRLG